MRNWPTNGVERFSSEAVVIVQARETLVAQRSVFSITMIPFFRRPFGSVLMRFWKSAHSSAGVHKDAVIGMMLTQSERGTPVAPG